MDSLLETISQKDLDNLLKFIQPNTPPNDFELTTLNGEKRFRFLFRNKEEGVVSTVRFYFTPEKDTWKMAFYLAANKETYGIHIASFASLDNPVWNEIVSPVHPLSSIWTSEYPLDTHEKMRKSAMDVWKRMQPVLELYVLTGA